jgi:hypothetical protein
MVGKLAAKRAKQEEIAEMIILAEKIKGKRVEENYST